MGKIIKEVNFIKRLYTAVEVFVMMNELLKFFHKNIASTEKEQNMIVDMMNILVGMLTNKEFVEKDGLLDKLIKEHTVEKNAYDKKIS